MAWRDEIMKICHDARWIPEFGLQARARLAQEHGRLDDLQEALLGPGAADLGGRETRRFRGHRRREELKDRAVEGWEQFEGHSPHRPWIDLVKIRNPKTGGT